MLNAPAKTSVEYVLFLFAFNVPLEKFTSKLWFIILHEYKYLTHKPPRSRWDRIMLQYSVIVGLIQFAFHLVHIPDFSIDKSSLHHKRAFSMLYGWCDTRDCSSINNSLLHIDPPISPKYLEL